MRFNKTTRIAAAVAVIGAVAAGGAAFTASVGLPTTSIAGYGTTTVTGGTVTDLSYGLSSDGSDITSATLLFTGDLTGDTVGIGFDNYNSGALQSCTVGAFASGSTTVTCDLSSATIPTATQGNVDVAVTGP